jgi:hypothetical protein
MGRAWEPCSKNIHLLLPPQHSVSNLSHYSSLQLLPLITHSLPLSFPSSLLPLQSLFLVFSSSWTMSRYRLKLRHDRFLPDPFHFIINKTPSVVKQATNYLMVCHTMYSGRIWAPFRRNICPHHYDGVGEPGICPHSEEIISTFRRNVGKVCTKVYDAKTSHKIVPVVVTPVIVDQW